MRKTLPALSVAAALLVTSSAQALEQGFKTPPQSARPRVWWHWMNGNVSQAGIRLDLEWMRRAGIGGLQQVDADLGTPQVVPSRIGYMSPEWRAAVHESAALAESLGLEFGIAGSPGWSESGGPWVKPADAMKKLVWSSTEVEGGRAVDIELAAPPSIAGPFQDVSLAQTTAGPPPPEVRFYSDVAVIAYRLPEDATADTGGAAKLTSSAGAIDAAALFAGSPSQPQALPYADGKGEAWLQVEYERQRVIRSVTVRLPAPSGFGAPPSPEVQLLASDDGRAFRKVADLGPTPSPERTASFPAVEARWFRLAFRFADGAGPPPAAPGVIPFTFGEAPKRYEVSLLRLESAARVNRFEEKAGFAAAPDYYALATPDAPASSAVAPAQVVDLTSKMGPDGRLRWTPPPGRWAILRFGASPTGHRNGPAPPEATGLEVDKLDRDKVRAYLATYLGANRSAAGPDLFGRRGVRTLLNDSIEAGPQNWTDHMLDQFSRRRGYDPRPWLPALTGVIVEDAAASDRFLWDWRRTIAELLAQNHYGEIARSAHALGLIVYGEALEDHRPQLGDDMEMRQYTDVPMAAMWVAPKGGEPNPSYVADDRGAASVAHIYGQNIVAAESMTAFGQPWAFSPRDLKRTADLEFALGINQIVIHTSTHQPLTDDRKPGLALAPFLGQYFTRNETWAEQARPWMDYLARSDFLLQQGRFVADVAYFYGEEAPLTAQFGDRLATDAPGGRGWDFVNSDVVLHRLSVDRGALATPSGMRYRALYLGAGARYMTVPVLRKLRDLVLAGAVVVGPRPLASPSLADSEAAFKALADELWPAGVEGAQGPAIGKGRVFGRPDIDAALLALGVAPDVEFRGASAGSELLSLHRRAGAADIYFVTNQKDRPESVDAVFRVRGKAAEIWSAEDGAVSDASWRIDRDRTVVPLKLEPQQSLFVVFRRTAAASRHDAPTWAERPLETLSGPWSISFQAGRGAPAGVRKTGLGSWTESPNPGVRFFSGTARYTTKLTVRPDWIRPGTRLMLDLGDVRDLAEVVVNGRKVATTWTPPYRLDLTRAVRPGTNALEVRVVTPWKNRLIGDAQPGAVKYTFTTGPIYAADAPLRPSGLLGPVRLVAERKGRSGTEP